MKIIFFGNGSRGVRCLEVLQNENFVISAVVGHVGNSEVIKTSNRFGIPSFQTEKVNAVDFVERLREFSPDLFILAGYNQILKRDIIKLPKKGVLNLHGGKLPEYRGVAPINWQIIKGETIGGCCIIFVDEGIDTGDIVEQVHYKINVNDTAEDIVNKQLELFPVMLLRVINDINNDNIKRIKQNRNEGIL